jgi:hypothetical protein
MKRTKAVAPNTSLEKVFEESAVRLLYENYKNSGCVIRQTMLLAKESLKKAINQGFDIIRKEAVESSIA